MMPLRLADLNLGSVLGRGGQGVVYAVRNLRIDQCWDAVYKEYKPSVLAAADLVALEQVVEALPAFATTDAAWLRDNSAWPAGLVQDGGRITGFLMRAVPPDFFFTPLSLSSTTQNKPKLSAFEFLFNDESYMADIGLRITDHDRLMLLAFLAGSLHRMHRLGIAIGDLSPKNLLFRVGARPACFFIDCDAMRVAGSSVLPQVETPDWELPTGEELATPAGDVYKLGLLAIRLFDRNQNSKDLCALEAISKELGELAMRSLDDNPARRPLPVEWLESLYPAAQALPTAPVSSATTATNAAQTTRMPVAAGMYGPGPQQFTPAPGQQPVGVGPARPGNAGLRAFGATLAAAAVLAGLIAAGVGIDHAVRDSQRAAATGAVSSTPTDTGNAAVMPTSDSPTAAPATTAPTSVGIVQIAPSLASDPRAEQVAGMFNTYFQGIDTKNYAQAVNEYDPSGVVDPTNSTQVSDFEKGVSTSNDSQIDLLALAPSGSGAAATAQLTFQSHQSPGYGPQGNTDETCTDWNLTYTLSQSSAGVYLILGTQSASDSAC
ncbi:hypothetical protein KDK95_16570 [Actinospica sp. MGRD01-02]|uniref:Protein kinase domain-containing protein n=1 Tax=Actinospica acidithermotolerans TaxID=2828514 RepID=A0A941EC77_9ACTN|nr:hypothetical protein [Actinospica acidithermotolerans]MBR7827933.1 hypothetical protein [Actinospica acidithermotolerans]